MFDLHCLVLKLKRIEHFIGGVSTLASQASHGLGPIDNCVEIYPSLSGRSKVKIYIQVSEHICWYSFWKKSPWNIAKLICKLLCFVSTIWYVKIEEFWLVKSLKTKCRLWQLLRLGMSLQPNQLAPKLTIYFFSPRFLFTASSPKLLELIHRLLLCVFCDV